MVYTVNIPQPDDNPSQSQPQLLANFQEINTVNSVNHVAYNVSGQGKHKFMQMPEQGAAPTTAANEGALYTKEANSITELFYRREGDGTEIQLTTGGVTAANNGTTFLPGGIIINWGRRATPGAVTFNTAFPNSVFSITLGSNNTDATASATFSSLSTSGVTLHCTEINAIHYIAIGN
jgi:hypothetical protein